MVRRQVPLILAVAWCAVLFIVASVLPMRASQVREEPSCSISPDPVTFGQEAVVTAVHLDPPDGTYRVSFDHSPGTWNIPAVDGTLVVQWTAWRTGLVEVWIIQRGRGPSLVKLGPQLNDYKVIAICSVGVNP